MLYDGGAFCSSASLCSFLCRREITCQNKNIVERPDVVGATSIAVQTARRERGGKNPNARNAGIVPIGVIFADRRDFSMGASKSRLIGVRETPLSAHFVCCYSVSERTEKRLYICLPSLSI